MNDETELTIPGGSSGVPARSDAATDLVRGGRGLGALSFVPGTHRGNQFCAQGKYPRGVASRTARG